MTMVMRAAGGRRPARGICPAGWCGAASVATALFMLAAPAAAQQPFETAQILRDQGGGTPARQSGEAALRVERVEAQMRTLNGQVEELTFQIRQLTEQLRRMQEDNEFRFQELEAGRGKKRSDAPAAAPAADDPIGLATLQPDGPAPVAGGAPEAVDLGAVDLGGLPAGALDVGAGFAMEPLPPPAEALPGVAGSSADAGAPPRSLGTLPLDGGTGFDFSSGPLDLTAMASGGAPLAAPPVAGAAPPAGTVSDIATAPAPGTQVAALPSANDPRESYDAAYNLVLRGEYASAESGFRRFLDSYPGDRLVPDAQFWLGESLYARADYRAAAQAFLKGYTEHPDSRKGPDSLFKLGLSLGGLGEKGAACASYAELLQRYPQASASLRDRVAAEQKTTGC